MATDQLWPSQDVAAKSRQLDDGCDAGRLAATGGPAVGEAIMADLPPSPSPFAAGLAARCPRCGQGPLFRSGLILREACERCGLSYAFADSGDGPAVFAILILGFLILAGALLVEFRLQPPVWVHVLLWGVLTPILALGLLRVLKATLIALQYKHKAGEVRD